MRRWLFSNKRIPKRRTVGQRRYGFGRETYFQKVENFLIRTVVLATVFLVLAQMGMGLAKDPVDFYLSVAQSLEAPSLDSTPVSVTVTPKLIRESTPQTYQLTLRATPAAPIRVMQKGKVLGTLAKGELEIPVEVGNLQLDGSDVPHLVQVQVVAKGAELSEPQINQILLIEHNIKTIRVVH